MELMSTILILNEDNARVGNILTGLETVCNYGCYLYHVYIGYY